MGPNRRAQERERAAERAAAEPNAPRPSAERSPTRRKSWAFGALGKTPRLRSRDRTIVPGRRPRWAAAFPGKSKLYADGGGRSGIQAFSEPMVLQRGYLSQTEGA